MTHFMGQSGLLAKAWDAVRCGVSDKAHNAGDGPEWPTGGRVLLPSGSVAHCLRYTYRGAARALPQGKIIPVKWVNSQFLWYYTPAHAVGFHRPSWRPSTIGEQRFCASVTIVRPSAARLFVRLRLLD